MMSDIAKCSLFNTGDNSDRQIKSFAQKSRIARLCDTF